MTEKMRDGVIKRGSVYYYVVRERGHFPVKDRNGNPKLDEDGNQIFVDVRQRWVKGARTREATKALRDESRNAVHRGTYVAPQDLTFGKYLDDWIEAHSVELKPSTTASYRNKIDLYLKPAIGHERLQSLSPSRFSTAFRNIVERGGKGGRPVSARTGEFVRAIARRALNDAVVDRLIEVNPVIGSKTPKKDGKPKHTTWTGEQVQTFLDGVAGTRLAPLWQLALATGMRRGELMALTWEHVDLEAGIVSVERSTTQVGNELVTTTPKNHERRNVQLDARTVAALRAWRKIQAEERLAWGAAYEDAEGVLFTSENGSRLSPNAVSKAFLRAQAGLGLPRISIHSARHSHATVLLRDRVPVHIVAKRLGHRDPSITLNVYADVIPDDDTSAVDVFSRAVWGA